MKIKSGLGINGSSTYSLLTSLSLLSTWSTFWSAFTSLITTSCTRETASTMPSNSTTTTAATTITSLKGRLWQQLLDLLCEQQGGIKLKHYCAIALFTTILYINALNGDFAYDDSRAIKTNQDLLSTTPWYTLFLNDFWGTPLKSTNTHGSYRPITVVSFRINNILHGLSPFGFHAFNIILHAIVTILFMKFSAQLFNDQKRITLISGALFACHPIHVESIASIVGRADVGAAIFYILSIMSYIKYCKYSDNTGKTWTSYLYISLALAALSMLTKEHGITALGVCAVYHLFIHYKLFPLTPENIYAIITERRYKYLRKGLLHLCVSATIFIGIRLGVMGSTPAFAPSDNPASDNPSVIIRFLTFLYLPAFNFWLLIYPRWLSFDWSMEAIPLIHSVNDSRNIVSLLFYISLIVLLKFVLQYYYNKCSEMKSMNDSMGYSLASNACGCAPCCYQHQHHQHSHLRHLKRPFNLKSNNNNTLCSSIEDDFSIGGANNNGLINVANTTTLFNSNTFDDTFNYSYSSTITRMDCITMSLALMIIPFLPATNLFFYVGFVIAERILYIPSFGYCLFISIGIESFMKRKTMRFITLIALSILLISFSLRTFVRNIDWLTEENLYRSGIAVNPPKAYGNLANILSAQGKKKEAESAYKKALTYRFNMADVHYNLGILLQEQGRYEEALQSYKSSIQFRPRLAMAHLNMGLVLVQLGKKQEAIEVYKHCSTLDGTGLKDPKMHESTKISALFNLGRIYADDGRYQEAINIYNDAIQKMPNHYQAQSLYNMIGEAYFKLGQLHDAEHWFKQSLSVKWDHIPAHLTYAKLLAKWNRLQEAEQLFLKAKELDPNDSSVYQHYGQFLSEQERHEEAAEVYLTAVKLSPNDYEIIFNTANTLRQVKRNQEAENFYREATKLRPNEATSHMNLGAMLHVNGKLIEAEISYLEALRLKPDDAITQNNLAKLRHLLNQKRAVGT